MLVEVQLPVSGHGRLQDVRRGRGSRRDSPAPLREVQGRLGLGAAQAEPPREVRAEPGGHVRPQGAQPLRHLRFAQPRHVAAPAEQFVHIAGRAGLHSACAVATQRRCEQRERRGDRNPEATSPVRQNVGVVREKPPQPRCDPTVAVTGSRRWHRHRQRRGTGVDAVVIVEPQSATCGALDPTDGAPLEEDCPRRRAQSAAIRRSRQCRSRGCRRTQVPVTANPQPDAAAPLSISDRPGPSHACPSSCAAWRARRMAAPRSRLVRTGRTSTSVHRDAVAPSGGVQRHHSRLLTWARTVTTTLCCRPETRARTTGQVHPATPKTAAPLDLTAGRSGWPTRRRPDPRLRATGAGPRRNAPSPTRHCLA